MKGYTFPLMLVASFSVVACGRDKPDLRLTEYVQVVGSTACQPIPIPGSVCPKALTFEEVLQVRGTLDMCLPHAWKELDNITDSGFGFEAKAAEVSPNVMDCLSRYLTKKVEVERVRH